MTTHQAQDFRPLAAECHGFLSERQLAAHFELYRGYVNKLNEIEALLARSPRDEANYSFAAYSELRRREPVAYNGTVLHELYFGSLGRPKAEVPAALRRAAEAAFGSWDQAMTDLTAMTQSTHGWVLVTCDLGSGRLRHNLVHSEHDGGLLANQAVLLAIDCWEHAYFLDFALRKSDYVAGVLSHVQWPAVQERFTRAALPEAALPASAGPPAGRRS